MMMRKKLLAAAVAAGILAPMSSHAVNVSLDGSGQALLYPYYNVNDGNVTFVSVTNTTSVAKAVKVRFREGAGSEDVFDFSLYLSPEDVWVAAVSRTGDSVGVSVADTTCTVPVASTLNAGTFNPTRINAAYTGDIPNRLSEGHIEIIEMAELPYTALQSDIADAITHDQSASPPTPVDCTVPTTFSANQSWAILDAGDVTAGGVVQDFAAPGGGLIGNAAVFNPSSGVYFPYNATALNQYSANPIWWPQNSQEFQSITDVAAGGTTAIAGGADSNANPHTNYFTADDDAPLSGGNVLNFDLPDLSTPSVAEVAAGAAVANQYTTDDGLTTAALLDNPTIKTGTFAVASPEVEDAKRNAVTASLMGNAITGEFITSGTFATDWVVTFPTRYLHVTQSVAGVGGAAEAPFTIIEAAETGQACETIDFDYWNREETQNTVAIDVGISPGVPSPGVVLCYEVNALSLNDANGAGVASEVLGSITNKVSFPLGTGFEDGWAQLGFSAYSINSNDAAPVTFTGLPVIGFSAVTDTVAGLERGGVFPSRVTFDQTSN